MRTNVPNGLTMVVTDVRAFAIEGGKAPYSVISNREGIAVAGVDGSTLAIGGVFPGSAELTIRDSLGQKVTAAVTITENGLALSTTAPSSVTLQMGQSQTYPVRGGIGPYSVTSANPNIVSAALGGPNNSSLILTGITPGGPVNVVVRDSLGATVIIAATVTTAGNFKLFTTAPSPLNVPLGSTTSVFSIGGGVPFSGTDKYAVSSSNPGVATVAFSGNSFTIHGVSQGAASILIRDSVNTVEKIEVTVPAAAAVVTDAPNPVTLSAGSFATYNISGGVPQYTAVSSDASVATAELTGSSVKITALKSGKADIQIRDSVGGVATISVTVPTIPLFTTAPAEIIINFGSPAQTFLVSGGVGPYSVTSNNVAVASVSPSSPATTTGPYAITPLGQGSAVIQIMDAAGQILTVKVTVGSPAPLSTTTPPTGVTLAATTSQVYSVRGGTGTYTITNTNPFNVGASVSGSASTGATLTLTGLLVGNSTITVRDGAGAQVAISVTVIPPGTSLRLLPESLSITETNNDEIDLSIFGGVGPYRAFTTDSALAPVEITGSKFQIMPSLTNRCVSSDKPVILTVIDSQGASATSTLTVVNGTGACP